jgi:hypothetical protein
MSYLTGNCICTKSYSYSIDMAIKEVLMERFEFIDYDQYLLWPKRPIAHIHLLGLGLGLGFNFI